MALKIETAPRLGDGVQAFDVLAEWFVRAAGASVHNPRKDGEPYRKIEIPESEFRALMNRIASPGDDQIAGRLEGISSTLTEGG